MLTRDGICYDLNVTPWNVEIKYPDETLKYRFSSEYYLNNFRKKLENNRKKINESLTKRFGIEIENNKLCDIKLYQSIEKRGFLLESKEEKIKCLNNIKLNGQNRTSKN